VRRGFVAERYAALVKALYDGSKEADISTEVTFEDGRKGVLSARVKVRDVATVPVAPNTPGRRHEGTVRQRHCRRRDSALDRKRVAVIRRRCARSATCRSTPSNRGEIRAIIGPMAPARPRCSRHQRLLPAAAWGGSPSRRDAEQDAAPRRARGGIARTFQNVAMFKGMSALDNIMAGRT